MTGSRQPVCEMNVLPKSVTSSGESYMQRRLVGVGEVVPHRMPKLG